MKFVEMKMTYEWFTPTGRRRQFFDFATGIGKKNCIDKVKKVIKQRIRHENYKILKVDFKTFHKVYLN